MYKLNGLWCGLLTCVNYIFILIPLWPCVCISIHVRVYKLARNWSKVELNRTHPTLLLWTTRSTINYATENAVLSLCSMNIARNYWVTLKCNVATFHYTYWGHDHSYLEQFESILQDSFWTRNYTSEGWSTSKTLQEKYWKIYRSTTEGQIFADFHLTLRGW